METYTVSEYRESRLNGRGLINSQFMNAATRILGATVRTGSGEAVGHVDDIFLNLDSGRVQYLTVRSTGDGFLCVRLSGHDLRVDALSGKVTMMPGKSPAKNLLLRAGATAREKSVH